MAVIKRLVGDMAVAAFILFVIGSAYFLTAQWILIQKENAENKRPAQVAMIDEQVVIGKYIARLREEEHKELQTGKGSEE